MSSSSSSPAIPATPATPAHPAPASAALQEVVLPKVDPKFDVGEFEPGISKSKCGHWDITSSKIEYGHNFEIAHDGKRIPMNSSSVLFGAFDVNEYKGKPTESLKLSGTAIYPKSLPAMAKEESIRSLAQIFADQGIISRTMKNYLLANKAILAIPDDVDDMGEPTGGIATRIRPPLNRKIPSADPAQAGKKLTPFYTIGAKLYSDRGDGSVREKIIRTPIMVNAVYQKGLTRGALYEIIKGARFYLAVEGYLAGFLNSNKSELFLTVRASTVQMRRLAGGGDLTDDEVTALAEKTVDMFSKLGFEDITEEEQQPPQASSSSSGEVEEPYPEPSVTPAAAITPHTYPLSPAPGGNPSGPSAAILAAAMQSHQ